MKSSIVRNRLNPKLEVTAYVGHFATLHSHNNYYIDITRIKHENLMAREAATLLAQRYAYDKWIDTVICLDNSMVIGTCLARRLAEKDIFSINKNQAINVITPERDANGQMYFRDNIAPMVTGKNVLILFSAIHSGSTAQQALQCVGYYGGIVQGIAAAFSSKEEIEGVPVYSLFTPEDFPLYSTHTPESCPMCKAGQRVDALSNSYGLSKL